MRDAVRPEALRRDVDVARPRDGPLVYEGPREQRGRPQRSEQWQAEVARHVKHAPTAVLESEREPAAVQRGDLQHVVALELVDPGLEPLDGGLGGGVILAVVRALGPSTEKALT